MSIDLIAHAMRLSEELGMPAFPVRVEPDPKSPGKMEKRPLVAGWQNGGACSNPEGIETLFAAHPNATNVGIVTGRIVVIDLDGAPGIEWWQAHADILPPTRTQQTQREGGRHLFYELPPGVEIRNSAGQIAPGVDVRGTGGFVCDWSALHPPVGDEIAEAPAALIALLTKKAEAAKEVPARAQSSGEIAEGSRNDSLMRLAGKLRRSGLAADEIEAALLKINTDKCKPPLSNDEVAKIAKSVGRYPPANQDAVTLDDFYAYLPMHQYIFVPCRELWPSSSVNARASHGLKKLSPSEWLDAHRSVEQMTWAPGEPMVIEDRLIANGGWIERPGCRCFNLYRPPSITLGDPAAAGPWLEHGHFLFGDDLQHALLWLAHRVQHPGDKINHALVIGGGQGIGKDTFLEPVKRAVGPWNFNETSPIHLLGRFNSFVKSVILRVSEARDLGDVDRFAFYDHMKVYTAAPPDVLRVDEKNIREYSVMNVCGVIITSNHKSDGIYLPADDRRHYVAWSDLTKEDFTPSYWIKLWNWYAAGGYEAVAGYLAALDLSEFDSKAPPPKTAAFLDIVDANRSPEDADLADILDAAGNPKVITLDELLKVASRNNRASFHDWLSDRRNRRAIPHRFEAAGYVPVRNATSKDGLFKLAGRRQAVYALKHLPLRDRLAAVEALRIECGNQ